MRILPWSGAAAALALALLGTLAAPTACDGSNASDDGGAGDDAYDDGNTGLGPEEAGEPAICMAFTEAGDPCPLPSPVRCFQECEAGGCSCIATPQGPRWTCQTDLSCVPPCAPIDDGCAPTD